MEYASLIRDRIVYTMQVVCVQHASQDIIYRLRGSAKGQFLTVWSLIRTQEDALDVMKG